MFVLDTDHLSVLEWADNSATRRLLQRLSRLTPEEAVTTIINFEEQMRGWLAYLIPAVAQTVSHPRDNGSENCCHCTGS